MVTIFSATFTSLKLGGDVNEPTSQHPTAFNALKLLVVHQEEHSACKKLSDEELA